MKNALEIATLIGIRIKDFYYMTPYELSLYVTAYSRDKKAEQENLLTQAYLTAAWQRAKKMPKLEDVLKGKSKKKQMTDKQLFNMVQALNAAFGGEVKEVE